MLHGDGGDGVEDGERGEAEEEEEESLVVMVVVVIDGFEFHASRNSSHFPLWSRSIIVFKLVSATAQPIA